MTSPYLPTLPAMRARGLSILLQQDATLAELAAPVESAPALTAALLRAANSAVSSPRDRVATAADAIVRVGIDETRRIVIGAILQQSIGNLDRSQLDLNEMWRHLLATALLADSVTWHSQDPKERSPAAFTAGLLHDIGRLALLAQHPVAYNGVVDLVHIGSDPIDAERYLFDTDHLSFGAEAARAWELPQSIVDAISLHHEGSDDPLVNAVWRGRRITRHLGFGDGLSPPVASDLASGSADAELIAQVGGIEGLNARIDWYRGAFGAGS